MLWLFNTLGGIFGPFVLLAGVVAVVLCVRAGQRAGTPAVRRAAVWASLMPLAGGVAAMLTGLALWAGGWYPRMEPQTAWLNLGKAVLAGLVVTAVPFVWATTLNRTRRAERLPS